MPTHPATLTLIEEYLEAAGYGQNQDAPLSRLIKNNVHGHTVTALTPDSIYFEGVLKYLNKLGVSGENMGAARDAGPQPRPTRWITGRIPRQDNLARYADEASEAGGESPVHEPSVAGRLVMLL